MMSRNNLPTLALLGTAAGDAFGLKAEGAPRRAVQHLDFQRGPFLGRAILSDDTEQSFLVAQSLLVSGGDPEKFERTLRWRLIGWFFALPPGVGLGTARSVLKLAVGGRRGIATAGNGAAMRSAVIGATFASDVARVEELVRRSTYLTHADPRAFVGALAVGLAAGASSRGESLDDVLAAVRDAAATAPDADGWSRAVTAMQASRAAGASVAEYAASIGCGNGVDGYVYHTVPVALYAWASHDDAAAGVEAVWRCGGDTDTVGAIAGALLYARAGVEPATEDLGRIVDWPLTVARVRAAGDALTNGGAPVRWPWWMMPVRNLLVFPLILFYALAVMTPRKLFRHHPT